MGSKLVLGVFLAGCIILSGDRIQQSVTAEEFIFEQYEVVTGSAKRQTVLVGFFLGGIIADLAVLNIDEDDNRRLRIYAFGNGNWVPSLDVTLRPEILFVDVANVGGRDRLVTYERAD